MAGSIKSSATQTQTVHRKKNCEYKIIKLRVNWIFERKRHIKALSTGLGGWLLPLLLLLLHSYFSLEHDSYMYSNASHCCMARVQFTFHLMYKILCLVKCRPRYKFTQHFISSLICIITTLRCRMQVYGVYCRLYSCYGLMYYAVIIRALLCSFHHSNKTCTK